MTATPDANDVLFGSNAPTAKFDQPGTTIGGVIAALPRAFQEREFNIQTQRSDGPGKTFPSGDPIMGVAIDVQTNLRDPSIQNDDGIRTIYVQGKRLKDAVRDAVRQAGAQRLEVGAEIWVTFTGLGQAAGPGVNPPKEYAVRYVPGGQAALGLGQQAAPVQQVAQQPVQQQVAQQPAQQAYAPPVQQQPVQVAQQPQPVQQVAQAPAGPAQPTPEQIAGLLANRMDPRTVFPTYQLTPEEAQQVAAFTNAQV